MKKRKWLDLSIEEKQRIYKIADSLGIPPNLVSEMYESYQI